MSPRLLQVTNVMLKLIEHLVSGVMNCWVELGETRGDGSVLGVLWCMQHCSLMQSVVVQYPVVFNIEQLVNCKNYYL